MTDDDHDQQAYASALQTAAQGRRTTERATVMQPDNASHGDRY